MKQFLVLMLLLAFSLPVGLSIAGCAGTNPNNYCNKTGFGYGLKTNQVAAISLQPATTGISLAYGQTGQLQSPTATNCNGGSESVTSYTYGTSNLNLADISPTGAVCGGTWNRTSPGGIADFTICTPPTASAMATGCSGSTCVAYMTASAAGVTSNTVAVYVHPAVTQVQLSVPPPSNSPNFTGCFSQNQTSQLDATAYVSNGTGNVVFCAPPGNASGVTDCSNNLGHFTYTPVNSNIVTIDQNGVATAHQPGSTAVTATISNVSSTAGTFSTCPPASIGLKVASNGSTSATVTPGTPVPLTTTILDTQGNQITGVALDYSSTNPQEISVGNTGSVTTTFPSVAAITATCNPPTCNPSLITQIAQNGNGLPVVSNSVDVTSVGRNSSYLWMASPNSYFFEQIDLNTGSASSPIKMPYIPNSMVLDQAGANLYFGTYRELMIYSASTGSLTKEDTTVPGVVLAVSPDSSTVVIADQVRQVIYLYPISSSTTTTSTSTTTTTAPPATTSIGGLGTRAAFSPDSKTLYVTGPDPLNPSETTLYAHNAATGWSVYPDVAPVSGSSCSLEVLNNNSPTATQPFNPYCSPDVSVTVPHVGAFLSGPNPATAYGFCPNTTVSPNVYYPLATSIPAATDHLTATTNGLHILGASASPATLTDISLGTAASPGVPTGQCPRPTTNTSTGLTIPNSFNQAALPITPSGIDQIVASPDSSTAFVTYSNSSGTAPAVLPAYKPSATFNTLGTLSSVTLSGTATAPLAGVFSPDDSTFFVGTAGDNLVHFIDVPSLTDQKTINPGLTDPNGNPVPVQFLAIKPRPTT